MRSSQRSISNVIRVFQFGPQASDVPASAHFRRVRDRRGLRRDVPGSLEARKRPAKPLELTFGIYRIVPTDMKDMSSPDHFSLTPMSMSPRKSRRSLASLRLFTKPASNGILRHAQSGRSSKNPGGVGLWQIRDIRSESGASTLSRQRSVLPEAARLLLLQLDSPLPFRFFHPGRFRSGFCQEFSSCSEGVFSSRLMITALIDCRQLLLSPAVSQRRPRLPGRKSI